MLSKIIEEVDRKASEKFEQSLKKTDAPCKAIFTHKELKTCLPSLKPTVEKSFCLQN